MGAIFNRLNAMTLTDRDRNWMQRAKRHDGFARDHVCKYMWCAGCEGARFDWGVQANFKHRFAGDNGLTRQQAEKVFGAALARSWRDVDVHAILAERLTLYNLMDALLLARIETWRKQSEEDAHD